jgi:hypothetical protein
MKIVVEITLDAAQVALHDAQRLVDDIHKAVAYAINATNPHIPRGTSLDYEIEARIDGDTK